MDVSNNLSGNSGTVTGTTQTISNVHLTEHQSDLFIVNSFLLLAIFIVCLFSTIKSYVTKSCMGCKRLKDCEEKIKNIKNTLTLNEYIDKNAIKSIVMDISAIKKEITGGK